MTHEKRNQHRIEIHSNKTRGVVIMAFPDGSRAEMTPDAVQRLRESLLAAEMDLRLTSRRQ